MSTVSSVPLMVTAPAATTAIPTDAIHAHQLHHHHHMAVEQTEPTELEESETETQIHEKLEEDVDYLLPDDETVETDEIIEETGGVEEGEMEYYAETECEDSDDEEKLIGKHANLPNEFRCEPNALEHKLKHTEQMFPQRSF